MASGCWYAVLNQILLWAIVPEMLFGHLLTGSNFDDTEKRLTGKSYILVRFEISS